MGLIDHDHQIVREIIHQGFRCRSGRPHSQMTGIILDSAAKAGFTKHFNIEIRSLRNSLCLKQLVLTLEIAHPLFQFLFDILRRPHDLFLGNNIVGCRKNGYMLKFAFYGTGQDIDLTDPVNLISEKFDPHRQIRFVCRNDLDRVSPDPEASPLKIHFVSGILNIDQGTDHLIPILFHSRAKRNHHSHIIIRGTQTVNTGNAGYNNDIPAFNQGCRRRQTQLVDLLIDRRILGNISIRRRYIGLRLIIIVIGNKEFNRIFRKEFLEFAIKLRCKCFIV